MKAIVYQQNDNFPDNMYDASAAEITVTQAQGESQAVYIKLATLCPDIAPIAIQLPKKEAKLLRDALTDLLRQDSMLSKDQLWLRNKQRPISEE